MIREHTSRGYLLERNLDPLRGNATDAPACHELHLDLGPVRCQGHEAELRGSFLCSPSLPPHPELEEIEHRHRRWAASLGLCSDEATQSLALWKLWTDCCPNASAEKASLIPDYCLMYTVMDDAAEGFLLPDAGPVRIAESGLNALVAILGGEPASHAPANRSYPRYDALCRAMEDLRKRLVEHTHPSLYPLFMKGIDHYRRGVIQQLYFARLGLPMSRESQVYNRRLNVAIDPTVTLVCMLNDTRFAGSFHDHALLERAHLTITHAGQVVNDVISFPKETNGSTGIGQYHNLIAAELAESIRSREDGNALAAAIRRAFDFHNREIRDFYAISDGLANDMPGIAAYRVDALNTHRSFLDWTITADRYRQAFSLEDPVVHETPLNGCRDHSRASGGVHAPDAEHP